MKKIVFLGILLLSITAVVAQTITIKKTYCPMDQKGFHPKFNSNGNLLAFTSESYVGLDVYNFKDKSIVKISEESGAGFQPVFSKNNDKVFYKSRTYDSRLRKEGVKSFDLAQKTRMVMMEPRRDMKQMQSFENGFVVFSDRKLLKATIGRTAAPVPNYVWSDGNNLKIFKNNIVHVLNPVKDANGYIWASLSPNGKMILFTAAGQGTFICNLDGKIITKLGYLNAPEWYNDQFVVGMQDKDDGQFVTSSKILIKSIDGKTEKIVNAPQQIAMYPAAASSVGKIAYNTIDGDIYVVELEISK
ncbi:MAG TPA: hypothetical protein VFP20_06720 [Bacteroidales bacterium]|nr:hypothetical protein [Bacteroidales bacterium]